MISYLASHSPFHVHSSIFHSYSYKLPSFFNMSLILIIPSIPFTSYRTFHPYSPYHIHTLPPRSHIHSPFMPMLVINTRGTIKKCSYMLWKNTCLLFLPMLAFVPFVHFSSILLHASIPLSYVLDLGCPFHFLHFISYTSSIPFISLSLFHTLPPLSLISFHFHTHAHDPC